MNDLMLSIVLVIAGVGIGLVIGIARVPRARAIPMTAATALAVLLAIVAFVTGPAELWLGLALAGAIVLSSPVSSAWMWKHEVGVDAGYGWILTQELLRPGRLRQWHEDAAAGARSSSAARR
jgi:hypothetical protein